MPPIDWTTGGGIAGLIVACGYVAKQVVDWWRERRIPKPPPTSQVIATAQVGDAQTANAVLVQTIETLRDENSRLVNRVRHLEDEDRRKDERITELQRQLSAIASELETLRTERT